MKGNVVWLDKVEKPLFCKLDGRRKKLVGLKSEGSLLPTLNVDISGEARAEGTMTFIVPCKKGDVVLRAETQAERDAWVVAIRESHDAVTPPISPAMSRSLAGRASNSRLDLLAAKQVKLASRARSDPDITAGMSAAEAALGVPKAAKVGDLALLMEYSAKYSSAGSSDQRAAVLLELAGALLDKRCLVASTSFARAVLDLEPAVSATRKDEAARLMQRCELCQVTGSADGKGTGWSVFEKEVMPLCTILADEREHMGEGLAEDSDTAQQGTTRFTTECMNRVVVPLLSLALAKLPKPATKFVVCAFELSGSLDDHMPYDGLNLGVIVQDYSPANVRLFTDMLALLELKMAQLGECGPVLFSPSWNARMPGLRLSTREFFLGWNMVGPVEHFLRYLEADMEDTYIYQTMHLVAPCFVHGDRALLKRYMRDVQVLLDSHVLVPLGHTGPASYREYAVPKLPPKKKLDLCEPPLHVRRIKAYKLLGWIANRWSSGLFLVSDAPYPRMISLRDEFWLPLQGLVTALRVYFDVLPEATLDGAFDVLQNTHAVLNKRSVRHIKAALDRVARYQMSAQLKNRGANEYVYHRGVSVRPPGAWELGNKSLDKLVGLYQTVLPIVIGADDCAQSRTLTKNTFNLQNLKLETPWVRLLAMQRLSLDDEALVEALALAEGQPLSMNRIMALTENTSNARAALGDFDGALVDLGMLQEICIDQKAPKHVAVVAGKISVVLDLAGQSEAAQEARDDALRYITESHTAKRDRVCLLVNQGCHLMMQGQVEEARTLFETALRSATGTRQRRMHKRSLQNALPSLLHNLGTCLLLEGDAAGAVARFEEELELVSLREGVNSLEAAFCNVNLAAALLASNDTVRAKEAALAGALPFCRAFGRADEHVSQIVDFLGELVAPRK